MVRIVKAAKVDSEEGFPNHDHAIIRLLHIYCFNVLFLGTHFRQSMLSNTRLHSLA
jgi:hypothetical protein